MAPSSCGDNIRIAYLFGIPRSGTTLLAFLLNQHPEIYCPAEPWVMLALNALGSTVASHPAQADLLHQATEKFLGSDREALLGSCARAIYNAKLQHVGKAVFVDKTPRYYLCLDFIKNAVPEAKYLWIRRNPLDVAASYKKRWSVNLEALFQYSTNYPVLFDLVLGLPALVEFSKQVHVHTLRYEDLVRERQRVMDSVLAYLDVRPMELDLAFDASAACLPFGDRAILETNAIHANSVGCYRAVLSSSEIAAVLSSVGPGAFSELGYEVEFEEAAQAADYTILKDSEVKRAIASRLLEERWRRTLGLEERRKEVGLEALEADNQSKDELIHRLETEVQNLRAIPEN